MWKEGGVRVRARSFRPSLPRGNKERKKIIPVDIRFPNKLRVRLTREEKKEKDEPRQKRGAKLKKSSRGRGRDCLYEAEKEEFLSAMKKQKRCKTVEKKKIGVCGRTLLCPNSLRSERTERFLTWRGIFYAGEGGEKYRTGKQRKKKNQTSNFDRRFAKDTRIVWEKVRHQRKTGFDQRENSKKKNEEASGSRKRGGSQRRSTQ